jgi:hypothetical protein
LQSDDSEPEIDTDPNGFRKVIDLLISLKKPIIVHNGLIDIFHVINYK